MLREQWRVMGFEMEVGAKLQQASSPLLNSATC